MNIQNNQLNTINNNLTKKSLPQKIEFISTPKNKRVFSDYNLPIPIENRIINHYLSNKDKAQFRLVSHAAYHATNYKLKFNLYSLKEKKNNQPQSIRFDITKNDNLQQIPQFLQENPYQLVPRIKILNFKSHVTIKTSENFNKILSFVKNTVKEVIIGCIKNSTIFQNLLLLKEITIEYIQNKYALTFDNLPIVEKISFIGYNNEKIFFRNLPKLKIINKDSLIQPLEKDKWYSKEVILKLCEPK